MFSQLLFMRVRAAEKALAQGRLEEAHRLALQPDLKPHKRIGAVLDELAAKLIERARQYYRADQFTEALMDLDRAATTGRMEKEIEELRGYIRTVAAEQARKEQSNAGRVHQARERIERGSLAAGQNLLANVESGHKTADALKRRAQERAVEVATLLSQTRNLMESEQWVSAAERLRRAKAFDGHAAGIVEMENKLIAAVTERAKSALMEGRLAQASRELSALGDLGRTSPVRLEIEEGIRISHEAVRAVSAHEYAEARRHCLTLARLIPEARWVTKAAEELQQLCELQTTLAAGPLGERLGEEAAKWGRVSGAAAIRLAMRLDETIALRNAGSTGAEAGDELPSRLLLLVDGGGSYLIARSAKVSLGRAASEIPADIPLLSDLSERHANITRVDDDYFFFSGKDAEVGGKVTQQALLRDGDKIVLGKKAKLTFRLPSRKSTSALLELSDTTKMPHDVRKVVLFNQLALLGQSHQVHVYCRHAGPTLLLFERNGSLWLRAQSDGFTDPRAVQLRIGEPVELGGVSMVLQPWKTSGRELT